MSMDDFNRHASAQMAFETTVRRAKPALVEALRRHTFDVDKDSPVRALVRLARVTPGKPGLCAFETAVRASLLTYVLATPPAARCVLQADAQFLVEHFDRFTEVPLTSSPIKRVVSWACRKFRGAAQDAAGDEH